jgi:hypothetical protein
MDVLGFATLSVTGFAACAEFGSYAFVHPLIRRLPRDRRVTVEKGLLPTGVRKPRIVSCGARARKLAVFVSIE